MSTSDDGVTAAEVRTALNGISEDALGTSTIDQKISEAEVIVAARADAEATPAQRELAVRALAAKKAFLSEPPEERVEELDVTRVADVESYVDELRRDAQDALDLVENPDTGTRRTSPTFETF